MTTLDKIHECIREIEVLQDFVKVEFAVYKIDENTAKELLRITDEIKEGLIK